MAKTYRTFTVRNRRTITAEVLEETEEYFKVKYKVRKYGGLGLFREEYLKKIEVINVE